MSTDSEDGNKGKEGKEEKDGKGLRPWLLPADSSGRPEPDQPPETAAGADREAAERPADGGSEVPASRSTPAGPDSGSEGDPGAAAKVGRSETTDAGFGAAGSRAAKGSTAEEPRAKPPGRLLGGLSLLLALIALAGAGYLYYLLVYLQPEADTAARMEAIDQRVVALDNRLGALALEQRDALAAQQESQEAALAASEAALLTALNDVSLQGPPSAREWQLAEAQYLLRIANHRLLMERDVPSALRLLRAADQILMELDDFSLHTVRARLADEILALGSVEGVDVQGLFLRLEALKGQLDQLPLRLPEYMVGDPAEPDAEKSFWAVLGDELSNYLQLRRFDGSVKPLLAPEEAVYLELNLRLMLERAQLAALRREQLIYEESLTTAQEWIDAYLDLEELPVQRMLEELSSLGTVTLDRPLPDISGSLNELATVLRSPS